MPAPAVMGTALCQWYDESHVARWATGVAGARGWRCTQGDCGGGPRRRGGERVHQAQPGAIQARVEYADVAAATGTVYAVVVLVHVCVVDSLSTRSAAEHAPRCEGACLDDSPKPARRVRARLCCTCTLDVATCCRQVADDGSAAVPDWDSEEVLFDTQQLMADLRRRVNEGPAPTPSGVSAGAGGAAGAGSSASPPQPAGQAERAAQ